MTRPTEAFEATGGIAAGHWTERYAAQPEIVRYPNCVTDKYDVRRHTRFSPRMTSAAWGPGGRRYVTQAQLGIERRTITYALPLRAVHRR